MDKELTTHLMDLKEVTARVDERTQNIHKSQKMLREALISHEERDRIDFEKLHGRVNRNDKKLNVIMGGIGLASFLILAVISLVSAAQ